jgi:hypothetical protein
MYKDVEMFERLKALCEPLNIKVIIPEIAPAIGESHS